MKSPQLSKIRKKQAHGFESGKTKKGFRTVKDKLARAEWSGTRLGGVRLEGPALLKSCTYVDGISMYATWGILDNYSVFYFLIIAINPKTCLDVPRLAPKA